MVTVARRDQFVPEASYKGGHLDVRKLDPKLLQDLEAAGITKGELDKIAGPDHVIRGQAELDNLFTRLDALDKDGSKQTLTVRGKDGQLTKAGDLYERLNAAVAKSRDEVAAKGGLRFASVKELDQVALNKSTVGPKDKGDHVSRIQQALVDLGYDVKVTGTYDGETEAAMKRFQRDVGLKADGKVGQDTLGALAAESAAPGKQTVRSADYDQLLKDGRLDVTMAIGHDDTVSDKDAYDAAKKKLEDSGFTEVAAADRAKLGIDGARFDPNATYMSKAFKDPKTGEDKVAVVRLIGAGAPGSDAARAKASFDRALQQDEVVMYSGPNRNGRGADFDGVKSRDGDFVFNPKAKVAGLPGLANERNDFGGLATRPDYQVLILDGEKSESMIDGILGSGGRDQGNTDVVATTAATDPKLRGDHGVRFLEGLMRRESNNTMLKGQGKIEADAAIAAGKPGDADKARTLYTESGFLGNPGNSEIKSGAESEKPTAADLAADPKFQALPAGTKKAIDLRMRTTIDPVARQNISDLALSPGFAKLSPALQQRALETQERAPADKALTSDLVTILGNGNFQDLNDATKSKVLDRYAKHAGSPEARQALAELASSDGLRRMSSAHQSQALDVLDKAPTDKALAKDLVKLVGNERFREIGDPGKTAILAEYGAQSTDPDAREGMFKLASSKDAKIQGELTALLGKASFKALPATTRGTAFVELAYHPTDAKPRKTITALLDNKGFAGMAAADQSRLLKQIGGTNKDISVPARAALEKLLDSKDFKDASAADQTKKLDAFFKDETWAPYHPSAAGGFGTPIKVALGTPTEVKNHPFSTGTADALRYDLKIDGRTVPMFVPKSPDKAQGHFHKAQDVADALGAMPRSSRDLVTSITVQPKPNPADAQWAITYGNPNFRSYMTAGAAGAVDIYPQLNAQKADGIAGSMVHETGHTLSISAWGSGQKATLDPRWAPWTAAMASDSARVSVYAKSSHSEDFAETLQLYQRVKGTPDEAEIRRIMPARFALIDQLLAARH